MADVLCLDANVWIKALLREDPPELTLAARTLLDRRDTRLVAPGFAWAEVGSILRKKIRTREITAAQAETHWRTFRRYPVEYLDFSLLQERAWRLAGEFDLLTLYDAAYLACTELAPAEVADMREFWTADANLISDLGGSRPPYVHELTR